jgi:DNA-binding CsgD family transcriptional regulator
MVVAANVPAQGLLKSGQLLRLREGVLTLATPEAQSELLRTLGAFGEEHGIGRTTPLVLRRPNMSPVLLRTIPLFVPVQRDRMNEVQVLAIVIDPDAAQSPSMELLRAVYGLTTAECAVCLAIADGQTLTDYAAASDVSVLTARNQLRTAGEKMGARRQAEVVRKVLRVGLSEGAL